jgi:hypothetical protein
MSAQERDAKEKNSFLVIRMRRLIPNSYIQFFLMLISKVLLVGSIIQQFFEVSFSIGSNLAREKK